MISDDQNIILSNQTWLLYCACRETRTSFIQSNIVSSVTQKPFLCLSVDFSQIFYQQGSLSSLMELILSNPLVSYLLVGASLLWNPIRKMMPPAIQTLTALKISLENSYKDTRMA